ncbi:hypothetical protein P615_07220 [Brevibacillus laterosporus PE36]|nr:hypothetical protein P615_07220 [Brevibacillus laterosporus PE36]
MSRAVIDAILFGIVALVLFGAMVYYIKKWK